MLVEVTSRGMALGSAAEPAPEALAEGFVRIAVQQMANAIKKISVARGYDVTEAEDGEAALAIFSADCGEIGLILMDLDMPGMGGLAAARAIRGVPPRGMTVPIVALTRLVDPESRRLCFDAGMNGFLPKPISVTGIESIVCLVGDSAYRAHA